MLKDLDRQLDTVRQARRIEEASERKRPGEPTDQELRDLVVKWKGASRLAAEELFPIVKERVEKYVLEAIWDWLYFLLLLFSPPPPFFLFLLVLIHLTNLATV